MGKGSILVTGANGGVGQHVARYLLENGERELVCQYRGDRQRVDALLQEFDLDPGTHAVQADLTDEELVAAMFDSVRVSVAPVGRLVNVAGSSTNAMSWKMSRSDFSRVIDDSLLTTFLCCKHAIPWMREARYGRIVNISSIVGFTGVAGAAHYAAAKAGLIGFTKSVALEVASRGITANAIALGYFDTGLINSVPEEMQVEIRGRIPAARFGGKADVGGAVRYLLGDDSNFYTGQVLHLNGGQY
jgi:3-oxoacyl-[acyl-carrier protein] reductase